MNRKAIFFMILLILLFPFILNIGLRSNLGIISTDLDINAWLAYWGAYFGGAATLIAIYLTIGFSKKNIDIQLKTESESRRMSVRPFIDAKVNYNEFYPSYQAELLEKRLSPPSFYLIVGRVNSYHSIDAESHYMEKGFLQDHSDGRTYKEPDIKGIISISFSNIGSEAAIRMTPFISKRDESTSEFEDLHFPYDDKLYEFEEPTQTGRKDIPAFHLAKNETMDIKFVFEADDPAITYRLELIYADILGNPYSQHILFKLVVIDGECKFGMGMMQLPGLIVRDDDKNTVGMKFDFEI